MDFEPVFCLLCFKRENPVNAISCDEKPKVVTVLCRQFWFSPEEIQQKYVCGICWTYVADFNNFYEQIKMIHYAAEQQEIVLEEDSKHFGDNELNGTILLLEEESSSSSLKKLEDKLVVDKCDEPDPLVNRTNVETIVIEPIDVKDTFSDGPTRTNAECANIFKGNSRKRGKTDGKRKLIVNATTQQTEDYPCDECNYVLPTKNMLHEHRKQHTTSQQHTCAECGKSFCTARLLQQHHKRDHGPGLMCDICSKWFKTGDGLRNHQKNCHYPQGTERVECSICKRWLKNIGSLNKHMIRHKTSGKPNICEICGKVAPTYTALKSHKLFVHEMERTFRCLVCKKAFKRAFTLKEHMTIHTGSSLYNCPHCTRTFNSSANLHAHRKKKHPKEWEKSRNEYEKRFMGK
ncbi:zinc finger protein 90 [Anopheles moucheti]|uniref:zinc finger protein 90 n=1 Tax=Anopheles moucheti TaxID=186751 RepID=UPI0022F018B8|nr:zinc finger protein 90 [Anopheles moucheti]